MRENVNKGKGQETPSFNAKDNSLQKEKGRHGQNAPLPRGRGVYLPVRKGPGKKA